MTSLEKLLGRAGHVESVSFDADVIRAAVERRRARRRGAAAALAVVLVAGVVTGWAVLAGDSDDTVDVATESGVVGGVDLIGRWELQAVSEVRVVQEEGVFLEFDRNGTLSGFDGCNDFSTTWSAAGDRLEVGPAIESDAQECLLPGGFGLIELLVAGPTVGEFSGQEGSLQLTVDGRFVAFGIATTEDDDADLAEAVALDFLEAVSVDDWARAAQHLESSGASPVELGSDVEGGPYADAEIGRVIRLEPALAEARDLPGLVEAWCARHGGPCTTPLWTRPATDDGTTGADFVIEVHMKNPNPGPALWMRVLVSRFEGEWYVQDLPMQVE